MNKSSHSDLVSVIIPTYKRVDQTLRAIHSCLNQSYDSVQIIVVDDGSGFEYKRRLQEHFKSENRVEIYEIDHCGHPGIVRNFGLSKAKGGWIAFLDSDDMWISEKLELQLGLAASSGALAICSNAIASHDQRLLLDRQVTGSLSLFDLVARNSIVNSSVLIRRDLLNKVGGVVDQGSALGAEDFATWLRVAFFSDWEYLNVPTIYYESASSDSMKFSKNVSQRFASQFGLINFLEWMTQNGYSRMLLSKLFLSLIKKVIVVDLFFNPSTRKYKKSKLEE